MAAEAITVEVITAVTLAAISGDIEVARGSHTAAFTTIPSATTAA